ncbi:hypothetical protein Tco_1034346 [Tanacetum coccineum]
MRRSLGKLSHPAIGQTSRQVFFSSSAGNGGGRGRGRGFDSPKFSFVDSIPGKNEPNSSGDQTSSPSPLGHGRGKPLAPPPDTPQFSSHQAPPVNSGPVAGRGRGTVQSPQFQEKPVFEENAKPRTPIFVRKDGDLPPNQDKILPKSILSVLSGAGRGKPTQSPTFVDNEKVEEVNRHIRPKQQPRQQQQQRVQAGPAPPKMSQEDAINKARGILSRGRDSAEDVGGGSQMGTRGGFGGRGVRGGARGGRGGRGRGRGGRGTSYRDEDDDEDDEADTEADKANADKLARYLGPEKMDILVQAFEEAGANVLPSKEEEDHVDAMHTNLLLECEPEYLMADFGSNPDIDEKPPMPLEEALEKMKPFLMAYENIQSEKEWREVVDATMKNVPLMKELVDYYSGPNRVTAKQQGEELERVAKTLPESAPASVKRFTDRAVLSLKV